jgi:hypothetical protein
VLDSRKGNKKLPIVTFKIEVCYLLSVCSVSYYFINLIFIQALSGQCGFMAANMYARSIFGEDALANLSIEKPFNKPDAPVTGHIRIRAKSQVSSQCVAFPVL